IPWPAPMTTKPRPSSRSNAGKSGTGVSSARVTTGRDRPISWPRVCHPMQAEEATGVPTEDRGLRLVRQPALDDLRKEMTHAPAYRPRVQVGPEHHAFGAETHGKLFDEVEVVAQARVEHDAGRDVRHERALPRRLVRREGVEGDHREVPQGTRDRRKLPQ